MRHRIAGRKLGRKREHRLALLRNMCTSLFRKERIRTTLMKAKELRPFAEKLITLAKRETLHARRQVMEHIHDKEVSRKLFDTISARFSQRPGGYMRILHLGARRGDGADMAILELIGSEPVFEKKKKKGKKGKGEEKKGEKKEEKEGRAEEKKEKRARKKTEKEEKPEEKKVKKAKEEKKKGK
ncbi:MAG: 50S ribosomal protein L17 [Acidobacteriota bacterium]